MEFRVEGGRPRRTWLDSVEVDMAELEVDKEYVHDRNTLLQFSSLQMSNAGSHCRTEAYSSSLMRLGVASYLHSVMADAGHSGGVLNCSDAYVL